MPGGIGPRWNRQRSRVAISASRSGSFTRGTSPDRARTRSPGTHPSGATLYTPSSSRSAASTHGRGEVVEVQELRRRIVLAGALAHPRGERPGHRPGAVGGHRQHRAQHRRPAGPCAARRHSSISCSTAPSWRAKANSTSGRRAASSVSGHRVVGVRAVHQGRRHEHDVSCGDRGDERGGRAPRWRSRGDAPGLGVRRGEPHEHVAGVLVDERRRTVQPGHHPAPEGARRIAHPHGAHWPDSTP